MSDENTLIRTIEVKMPPHLETEEGAARFNAAVEARNQADYECFLVLRDLSDEGLANRFFFLAGLKRDPDMTETEAREMAEYHAERVNEALAKRRLADAEFGDALLGRKR